MPRCAALRQAAADGGAWAGLGCIVQACQWEVDRRELTTVHSFQVGEQHSQRHSLKAH